MNRQPIINIEQALKNAPYGTKISFQELTTIAGVDVLLHRSVISCANRHLIKHHQRRLTSARGYGYVVDFLQGAGFQPMTDPASKGYLILNVLAVEPDTKDSKAFLIMYRELKEDEEAVKKSMPADTGIVEFLKKRVSK